ncbi:MAG: hypothetical protein K2X82_00810 [Gemmataceae bacterium]|nr:hypothetical protein [Gemmataceae bacterium]
MSRLLVVPVAVGLILVAGCGRAEPTLTPEELAAGWEKHKGQTVVLSGAPKNVLPERRLALFYTANGNYRISAEVAEGSETPKPDQPCKLQGTVKGLEGKTVVVTGCKPLP